MTLITLDASAAWLLLLIVAVAWGAIASGVGLGMQAFGQSRAATTDARTARLIAENEDIRQRDLQAQQIAAQEAAGDPFAQVSNQVATASAFDRVATEQPLRISLPGLDPKYQVQRTGGYSTSQPVRTMATQARDLVMSGGGRTPTMTDPANYGRTGVQNFTPPAAAGTAPTPVPPAGRTEDALRNPQPGQTAPGAGLRFVLQAYGNGDIAAGAARAEQDPAAFAQWAQEMGWPGGASGFQGREGLAGDDFINPAPNPTPWRTSYTQNTPGAGNPTERGQQPSRVRRPPTR